MAITRPGRQTSQLLHYRYTGWTISGQNRRHSLGINIYSQNDVGVLNAVSEEHET
jgi:hypothetical protein